jgi:hypothetical protein
VLSVGINTHCLPAAPASQVCVALELQWQDANAISSPADSVQTDGACAAGRMMDSEVPVHHTSRVASHIEPLQQANSFLGKQAASAAETGRMVVS